MQHESNLEAVSIGRRCLTRSVPGQRESQLVKPWMLREREITDWSGLHKLLRGFIGRFSLTKTRRGKFSAWIDCWGSWKSFEERTSAAQAKQSHHFSCCRICVPIPFLTFPIWQPLYGLRKSVVLTLFNFENVTEFDKRVTRVSKRAINGQSFLGTDTCSWTLKELMALECPKPNLTSSGLGCLMLVDLLSGYELPKTLCFGTADLTRSMMKGTWWKF